MMNVKTNFSKYEPYVYAVLRIVTGFLFLWHGSQKVLGIPPPAHQLTPLLVFVAGPIELLGGLFVMTGLWTRWAAFICSGMMASAYWAYHGLNELLPIVNGGELAFLYCFLFLYIFSKGSGIVSIDNLLKKRTDLRA